MGHARILMNVYTYICTHICTYAITHIRKFLNLTPEFCQLLRFLTLKILKNRWKSPSHSRMFSRNDLGLWIWISHLIGRVLITPNPGLQVKRRRSGCWTVNFWHFDPGRDSGLLSCHLRTTLRPTTTHYDPLLKRFWSTTPLLGKRVATPW